MYFGHRAAKSIPPDMLLRTMHSDSWLARKPTPAKKVPALPLDELLCRCTVRRSSNGFHKYSPYMVAVAEVIKRPQRAVILTVNGAAMI